jgi:chromosome segregation ATPase
METPTPSPSPESPSPSSTGACWRLRWAQRLSWLISALSGTLEIEAETKRLKQDNERLDRIILQTKNETRQIEKENEQRKREHEQRMKEYDRDNERLDRMILQTKKENDRLHELESKIDGLFLKYDINSPLAQKPEQP